MLEQLQFIALSDRINAAYRELGHRMGWSFLYTPKSTLNASQQLLFLGLNPGGKEDLGYDVVPSCESGNEYLHGKWVAEKGKAPLQFQVQQLFKGIAVSMGGNINHGTMMDATLAANYVPFRSSTWATLVNKQRSMEFSSALWSEILDQVHPRVIICIAYLVYDNIKAILVSKGFAPIDADKAQPIGWGRVTYNVTELRNDDRTILLVRLPHLSTYKVFSSAKCEMEIKKLADRIASMLDKNIFTSEKRDFRLI